MQGGEEGWVSGGHKVSHCTGATHCSCLRSVASLHLYPHTLFPPSLLFNPPVLSLWLRNLSQTSGTQALSLPHLVPGLSSVPWIGAHQSPHPPPHLQCGSRRVSGPEVILHQGGQEPKE